MVYLFLKKTSIQCTSIFIIIVFMLACANENKKIPTYSSQLNLVKKAKEINETQQMVLTLNSLAENKDLEMCCFWNYEKYQRFQAMNTKEPEGYNRLLLWVQSCNSLLNAGRNKQCISKIESMLKHNGLSYETLVDSDLGMKAIETLALAYLRLGEEENCQINHNEHSCIIPFKKEAIHTLKTGSQKAITLFTLLDNVTPNDRYKWLINIACMTLGSHPKNVPNGKLIKYPNWNLEQKNFPEFRDVASKLGVDVNGLSGGVCLDDFNGDGWIDLFTTSYGMNDQAKFFINNGKGGFIDATEQSGIQGIVSGLNCIHADYDNDGDKDIFILRGAWLGAHGKHPNSLLQNDGNGNFKDVTRSAGLFSLHPTQTAAWADVNKDGFLDLFIGNESLDYKSNPCELYINQGDGTFLEQAQQFGLGNIKRFVKGVSFGDINQDQWPDLFISANGAKNLLYVNEKGRFQEIGEQAGIQMPIHSFPCWFWDVNNDGFQDLFVSSFTMPKYGLLGQDFAKELKGEIVDTEKPSLYLNNKDGSFSDRSKEYRIDKTLFAMGSNFGDIDNDGYLDFFIGNGSPDYGDLIPNRMFRNAEGLKFEEVTSAGRFGHIQKGHGIGFADLDQDGDQDIYAVMGGAYDGDVFTNVLYENPMSKYNWVVFELIGVTTNRSAIGSLLELGVSGRKIFRSIGTGGSFGANSLQAEIGLGSSKKIDQLTIHWQNGEKQTFFNVQGNQKYIITEGDSSLEKSKYQYVPFQNLQAKHQHH